ncbi:DUF397 domain-containing protein [Nocardiopsis ansamitocini]|uniref:DUF397 domain-containing protein n=1 Tax=Nocardiopsis ansamitocini TaxID=1670832 RepID=A0A9W6UL93_9ACTN|nr:DUF397 domain-containing protein [Nocardiopsis ansamitocini]GLU50477.1 hypothetical protein Nans01_48280 [Nocardiopsis ansamitocini]
MDLAAKAWKKSSYSNPSSNNCVEVANTPAVSAVRDTQNRDLGALAFSSGEWRAFLATAKRDAL